MPFKDPEKARQYRRVWQKKNYARFAEKKAARAKVNHRCWTRNWKLKGIKITIAERMNLFEQQNGKCAICGRHESVFKKALCVDHDHVTGKVRGLLCVVCNSQILVAVENYGHLIEKAREYISDDRHITASQSRPISIPGIERHEETDRCVGSVAGSLT